MTRRRRARRRPTVQFYANLTDRSSIGYVARELASYLGSTMGTDCTVQCTTGRRALDVPAAIQRHVSSADIGFFWGFPRDSRKHLWKHKQFIGAYVCEGNRIPHEWVELCNQHSAIIVPSQHCFRAFTDSGVTVPVHVIRHGLSPHFRNDGLDKFPGFIFFTAFNANPWMARKGVNELLGAFVRLKERYDQVWLIIKTNASPAVSHWGDLPGVKLVLNRYETPDLVKLYQQCHAYVQPTRGEGFGLTYIEALACGLPIVVPNHTGVTEFVDPERDCIIETDGSLVSLETYQNPIGRLYDVTEDAVYNAMLDVFLNQAEYRRKAATFDAAAWSWHTVLQGLHGIIDSVRAMPDRQQPAIVIPQEPQVTRGNPAIITPFVGAAKEKSGAPLPANVGRAPRTHSTEARLYRGDNQGKAYEHDCTGLGIVVRELSARMTSTAEHNGVLVAPFNPEHCDYSSIKTPVVAYTTFESDRWPTWWVKRLNHCAMVVVPQQWVKDSLLASGCEVPVAVVPQAYKRRRRPTRSGDGTYTFGFLGVPVKRKNLDLLIQALPSGARLRLHAAWLPHGSVTRGGAMVATTVGRIGDEELDRTFWSEIDCLVVPSSGEGYSMVPREAIAMGIPTIVSDIPAHKDLTCTKIATSSGEPAFYEFCGQTVGHWHKIDVDDLHAKLTAAMAGEFDVSLEDQRCPDHNWESTVSKLRKALTSLVVTYSPTEGDGGGVERFSRRLATEWDGAHHVSEIAAIERTGDFIECLVIQFEYGLFREGTLQELVKLKRQHSFNIIAIVHSANGQKHNLRINSLLEALADRLILLNPAQDKFFQSGQKSEHPWPDPGQYREPTTDYLGNHGNIHPQKGYRHLFAVGKELGKPVRIVGRLDESNPQSKATHKKQIAPYATDKDDLRLEYYEDAALDEAMGECAALLYPYEPVANIQASGAVRDAIRAGRPILCSGHEDYFDLPECFPRLSLDSPAAMAAQVSATISEASDVFEREAAHAREHGWSWFVSQCRNAVDAVRSSTRKRMAVIYDSPNWAFHRIALQIEKYLGKTYDLTLHPYTSLREGLLADCDYVINLALLGADRVALAMGDPTNRLVTCVYDHYTWREPKSVAQFSRAVEASALILCANEDLVRVISATHPRASLSTCIDGVDATLFSPREGARDTHAKLRVGWAGNSGHDNGIKRLHLLQEAVANVDDAELVLADSVLSPVAYADMPEWYRSIDVICCTSISEGTPNPVLEAASSGVSFISTDVGIVSHVGRFSDGRPGVIIEGSTREEIVLALTKEIRVLAGNRGLVEDRGAAARRAIEQNGWAWESQILQFVDALDVIAEGND